MSIITAFKKAKKAADEHNKAAAEQEGQVEAPPPYRHVPTHAARDALAFAPMVWSTEETQAKIVAASKRRNEITASAPVSPTRPTYQPRGHSRAHSDLNFSSRSVQRGPSDLSIDSVLQRQRPLTYRPSPLMRPPPPQPVFAHNNYSLYLSKEDIESLSQPRKAPSPPRRPRAHTVSNPLSSRPFETRMKSPLSIVTTEEELQDTLSQFSQDTRTTPSTQSIHSFAVSTASSQSSHEEAAPRRSGSSRSRKKLSKSPSKSSSKPQDSKAKPVENKRQSLIEISRPYSSEDKSSNIEGDKTASSTIPTWRYEDLTTETKPPAIVKTLAETIPRSHTRKTSRSISVFQGLGASISVS